MTIKKMLLFASMALAAIAFAAPAAQAEPEWYVNGVTLEGEAGFTTEGEITTDAAFATGPASLTLAGTLSNEGGAAGGVIEEAEIEPGPVPTNLPSCTAEGTVGNTSLPWSVKVTPKGGGIHTFDMDPPTFITHYFENGVAGGCPKFGVPSTVRYDGRMTLTVETGAGCFDLSADKDDLFIELTGTTTSVEVDLTSPNGPLCIESEVGEVTLE